MTYVKIRSYHVIRTFEPAHTKCGRVFDLDAETVDELPAERSCETCLRIVAREVDGWVSGEGPDPYAAVTEPAKDRITL